MNEKQAKRERRRGLRRTKSAQLTAQILMHPDAYRVLLERLPGLLAYPIDFSKGVPR